MSSVGRVKMTERVCAQTCVLCVRRRASFMGWSDRTKFEDSSNPPPTIDRWSEERSNNVLEASAGSS